MGLMVHKQPLCSFQHPKQLSSVPQALSDQSVPPRTPLRPRLNAINTCPDSGYALLL